MPFSELASGSSTQNLSGPPSSSLVDSSQRCLLCFLFASTIHPSVCQDGPGTRGLFSSRGWPEGVSARRRSTRATSTSGIEGIAASPSREYTWRGRTLPPDLGGKRRRGGRVGGGLVDRACRTPRRSVESFRLAFKREEKERASPPASLRI